MLAETARTLLASPGDSWRLLGMTDLIETPTGTDTDAAAGAFAERMFGDALGAIGMFTSYLGLRLGLYDALAAYPGSTSTELAERTGIAERYAREWLEQQTVSGVVDCEDRTAPADERSYRLPAAHALVLLDGEHPAHAGALALACVGIAGVVRDLVGAYRTGAGVPYAAYGTDFRDGQAAFNRPSYVHLLAGTWLAAFPELHGRLTAREPVRILDVACGAGWSSIEMAKAFAGAQVLGVDLDDASVADARRNAAEAGLGERIRFEVQDAADLPEGAFDLVTIFEAVHDLSDPVAVLAGLRRARAEGGHVLVMDERAADSFADSEGPVESFLYGASVLHCLPVGLAAQPSAGTGTVMRTSTLTRYATDAGFTRVEVLPVEHDLFRFYELR